jgi:calcineurin-like phosphoesterase family protein
MQSWFTSDEHYGHANIIKFCNRPFANIYEMQETLIDNHNARVKDGDYTYHLGDLFWRTVTIREAQAILDRLNGKHFLILGNHDEVAKQLAGRFEWVKDCVMTGPKPGVWLSHYAHRSWPNSHKGSYHLFGHTHNVLSDFRYSHDAGVDANNFTPRSWDEIDTRMKMKGVLPLDEVQLDMKNNPWKSESRSGEK